MSRPTVHDVARVANVSLSTVDRVLNGRDGVRAATQERVRAAMKQLGYERDLMAANLSRKRIYKIRFVIPDGPNSFMRNLAAELETQARIALRDRTEISVSLVPPFDGRALGAELRRTRETEADGVVMVATESAEVRQAVSELRAAGIQVVTLISDLSASARGHFVGIDNVSAGRTAAGLLGRFCAGRPGRIAIVAGSMLVRDHVERRLGFEQVMHSEFPELKLLPPIESGDEAARVDRLLTDQLREHPDIIGIYSLGGGNRGLRDALDRAGADPRPMVVVHELTDQSRVALQDGMFDAVLQQDIRKEVTSALVIIRNLIEAMPIDAETGRIHTEIFLRDNLP
ncbi:LacI family transcriptional regulator [Limimaricola soesokkakensis]|uniref:Catabolite control protein A n=1 Tax=Limimaricola soesokkakensis TaxID=1343159 RepID=A0A1X6ZDU0_9RHOB|nr:LacI family DNA-binding transcriptional regulator [Limimaricola soesokkakensis]PSK86318.1 LacI family transcriptional regulator [Limimaricola soesokkakensis]SLN48166.1 Catabolite control protein A [Limimaricola soesokkakensis]